MLSYLKTTISIVIGLVVIIVLFIGFMSLVSHDDKLADCQEKITKQKVTPDELSIFFGLPKEYSHPSFNAFIAYYDHLILNCVWDRK